MRAPGVISMLKPDNIAVDLSMLGADSFLNDICTAAAVQNAQVIFFATQGHANGENLAKSSHALWCKSAQASEFIAWLTNGYEDIQPLVHQPKMEMSPVAGTNRPGSSTKDSLHEKPVDTDAPHFEHHLGDAETPPPSTASKPRVDHVMLESPGVSRNGERLPSMDELLITMLDMGASDLHISNGSAPRVRVNGHLFELEGHPKLYGDDTAKVIVPIVGEKRLREYEDSFESDFSYSIPGKSRFRVNVFRQRGAMGAVLRTIPFGIPTMKQLGLPQVCTDLADKPRGLVLVTGPTGSGKSTTLAAMIDYINETKDVHIITMEDPIEFMHQNKKALINQREVGEDTESFAAALKHVLRQDPDVILVGEMRDLETISAAVTAAETGHLVFGTLHTIGGPETIDRIIDVFPPAQQNQIRMQLSGTLQGVLSQVLCETYDGKGRVLAQEIMLGIPAIGNLIREGKTHQMQSIIQSGGGAGMVTLDHSLRRLFKEQKITAETALEKAKDTKSMAEQIGYKF